jgi:hypothetical protein
MVRHALVAIAVAVLAVGAYELLGFFGWVLVSTSPPWIAGQ